MGKGSTSTQTVQATPLQNQQADILKSLTPQLTQYFGTQMQGMNAAAPALNQALLQALGRGTSLDSTATTNQMRKAASQARIAPGDPRMASGIAGAGEAATKMNLPELQTIMSLFGTNPQNLTSMMGAGPSAGGTTTQNPGLGQELGSMASLGVNAAMLYKLLPALLA